MSDDITKQDVRRLVLRQAVEDVRITVRETAPLVRDVYQAYTAAGFSKAEALSLTAAWQSDFWKRIFGTGKAEQ